jgi:nucleoside-diphosphate-sugar epimerase
MEMSPILKVVEQAFDGIDACFHLAAIASVVRSSCEWRRTHEVNLTGTINIFEQARRLRDRREIPVIYASTAAIYGDCNIVPIGEKVNVHAGGGVLGGSAVQAAVELRWSSGQAAKVELQRLQPETREDR